MQAADKILNRLRDVIGENAQSKDLVAAFFVTCRTHMDVTHVPKKMDAEEQQQQKAAKPGTWHSRQRTMTTT